MGQNSNEFKIDFKQTKDNLLPLFEEAFLYAIKKVDCERETKEIVKYINKAMLTKFIELQMQRDNVKRIRKGNDSVYVRAEINVEETDIWMMMFGKTLKHVGESKHLIYGLHQNKLNLCRTFIILLKKI